MEAPDIWLDDPTILPRHPVDFTGYKCRIPLLKQSIVKYSRTIKANEKRKILILFHVREEKGRGRKGKRRKDSRILI